MNASDDMSEEEHNHWEQKVEQREQDAAMFRAIEIGRFDGMIQGLILGATFGVLCGGFAMFLYMEWPP